MSPRLAKPIAGIALALGLVALSIQYCPVPWSAVLFVFSLVVVPCIWCTRRDWTHVAIISIATACLATAAFEGYLGFPRPGPDVTREEPRSIMGYIHKDDVLGYAPNSGIRVHSRRYFKQELISDVVYTINSDGLRIAPPTREGQRKGCVVFLGDSFTFGDGVNDEETFPYQVGLKTEGQYSIYNFAMSGYGAHQMLSLLQSGRIDHILRCSPTQFVYWAIPHHVERTAGLVPWDRHGPRFELDANGNAVRDGHFDDPPHLLGITLPRWIGSSLQHSFIWQRSFGPSRAVVPSDVKLFVAVVTAAARVTKERYPSSTFNVILWDAEPWGDPRVAILEEKLHADEVRVYRATAAIPDLRTNFFHYVLSIHDFHPNALLDELLANYIVQHVLNQP